MSVHQDQAVKDLLDFATNNGETQGKFTIGDEKVGTAVGFARLTRTETQSFHADQGMPCKPRCFQLSQTGKGYPRRGKGVDGAGGHGQTARDEK
jgi:hypothetical protein